MNNEFASQLGIYLVVVFCIFIVCLYLFRAIFNIPSFLRYQKAQVRLLQEIAKTQGVENSKVQSIVSESIGWETSPQQNGQAETTK